MFLFYPKNNANFQISAEIIRDKSLREECHFQARIEASGLCGPFVTTCGAQRISVRWLTQDWRTRRIPGRRPCRDEDCQNPAAVRIRDWQQIKQSGDQIHPGKARQSVAQSESQQEVYGRSGERNAQVCPVWPRFPHRIKTHPRESNSLDLHSTEKRHHDMTAFVKQHCR